MDKELAEAVVQLTWILIPIVVAISARVVVPATKRWLDAHTSKEQRNVIEALARVSVLFVEGYMKSADGKAKYDEACNHLDTLLYKRGIPTNYDEIAAHVQAAWDDEFGWRGKTATRPPATPSE